MGAIVSNTAAPPPLKMTFVGGSGVGKTSLIFVITSGYFHERFRPYLSDGPLATRGKYVYDPSPYKPISHRTGQPKDGEMRKRQMYRLALCDTSTSEDYDAQRVLSYTDAAVIALCFSVAEKRST